MSEAVNLTNEELDPDYYTRRFVLVFEHADRPDDVKRYKGFRAVADAALEACAEGYEIDRFAQAADAKIIYLRPVKKGGAG